VGVLSVLLPSLEHAWRGLDDQALRVKRYLAQNTSAAQSSTPWGLNREAR
jgi:hypothetical protein